MKKVFYPGSFDPITYGHMDIVNQALKTYDKVVIGVLYNSSKKNGMFPIEERIKLIKKIYENNPNIEVVSACEDTAAVDVALSCGCETIAKGLRDLTDFAYELKISLLNLKLSNSRVNTIAFFANPEKMTISSTMVKEVFRLNKDISEYVDQVVIKAMYELKEGKNED